jgi:hypothetical protein
MVVTRRGIFYIAAPDTPGGMGSLRIYDFSSRRRHNLAPVMASLTADFAVSPDERKIVLPVSGFELDLMMLEFESAK